MQGGPLGPQMGTAWRGEPQKSYGHILDVSEVRLILFLLEAAHIRAISHY